MSPVNIVLAGLLGLVTVAWALAPDSGASASGALPWIVRQQALYLSGLYSVALMSLAVMLSTRPVWLERPLGGLDRVYRLHKWSGILAVTFAAVHWLIEMSDDLLKAWIGRAGRGGEERSFGLLETLRDLGEDMGEWAIYAVLAMLAITLWKRFPYGIWRRLHRVMPVLYLMLAFHAAVLAPSDYWTQPIGAVLALLLMGGTAASIVSLTGGIGRHRTVAGFIVEARRIAPEIVEVKCRLNEGWPGHRPGQFAFVTFDRLEGAHPFTIATADRGDHAVTFEIKGLGNYTRGLATRLHAGQAVRIEGPYGRFDLARRDRRAQQLWIAGGIGITPFIAWLESLQAEPANAPSADLHYCTRGRDNDPFVARLQQLCARLPAIHLHIHDAGRGEVLTSETLAPLLRAAKRAEVWFCGPRGLARSLEEGLRRTLRGRLRFRQEAFELR
jgi:predicted ferric reductase